MWGQTSSWSKYTKLKNFRMATLTWRRSKLSLSAHSCQCVARSATSSRENVVSLLVERQRPELDQHQSLSKLFDVVLGLVG